MAEEYLLLATFKAFPDVKSVSSLLVAFQLSDSPFGLVLFIDFNHLVEVHLYSAKDSLSSSFFPLFFEFFESGVDHHIGIVIIGRPFPFLLKLPGIKHLFNRLEALSKVLQAYFHCLSFFNALRLDGSMALFNFFLKIHIYY